MFDVHVGEDILDMYVKHKTRMIGRSRMITDSYSFARNANNQLFCDYL